MDPAEILRHGAAELGVSLDATAVSRFLELLALLQDAGRQLNLTAVREPEAIVRRHFLESLALGVLLEQRSLLSPGTRMLDLGSGGGFPGLPLKLLQPQIALYLLEATAKKAGFLHQAIAELELSEAYVLAGRAETLARDAALRGSFDVVSARAVAHLAALVELALPFLRLDGTLAAIKGSRTREEIQEAQAALSLCGGEVVETAAVPGTMALRVVLVRKVRETPSRFPRRPGQPAAHPLRARG
jgi:16S rRNA (guanine527-N7)-methyltransferase